MHHLAYPGVSYPRVSDNECHQGRVTRENAWRRLPSPWQRLWGSSAFLPRVSPSGTTGYPGSFSSCWRPNQDACKCCQLKVTTLSVNIELKYSSISPFRRHRSLPTPNQTLKFSWVEPFTFFFQFRCCWCIHAIWIFKIIYFLLRTEFKMYCS